jgi:hypothetical protein
LNSPIYARATGAMKMAMHAMTVAAVKPTTVTYSLRL